jgi:outer membrane protein OmpA-like peptidoglycan-associated protein
MNRLKLGMRTWRRVGVIALGGALLSACAAARPSAELVDARRSYGQASTGPASQLVPDRLLTAKQALDLAERAHEDDPGSDEERTLAYIADRQARLASAHAGIAAAQRRTAEAEAAFTAMQEQLRQRAQQELRQKESNLEQAQQQLSQAQNQISAQRRALTEAEQRAAAAIASLEKIASIKQDPRGTIITLSGQVLFATGKSDLLPVARQSLNQVAEALKTQDIKKKIIIEGHTDAVGSDEANMKLSQQRAEAVRKYLVSQGISADRLQAIGKGEKEPIADDATPEGRANNRRVEIIVPDQAS